MQKNGTVFFNSAKIRKVGGRGFFIELWYSPDLRFDACVMCYVQYNGKGVSHSKQRAGHNLISKSCAEGRKLNNFSGRQLHLVTQLKRAMLPTNENVLFSTEPSCGYEWTNFGTTKSWEAFLALSNVSFTHFPLTSS